MAAEIAVSIDVADMERAIAFYTEALGFSVTRAGEATTVLSANGLSVYLLRREAGSNPLVSQTAVRDYARHWTPVHLDIPVADLNYSVAKVRELGGACEGEEAGDWGAIAYCADPFGNGFCLVALNT